MQLSNEHLAARVRMQIKIIVSQSFPSLGPIPTPELVNIPIALLDDLVPISSMPRIGWYVK